MADKKTIDELIIELTETRRLLKKKEEELEGEAARKYETIRDQTRTLDAFFNNTITPLAILDRDFNFIMVNPAYAKAGRRDISEFEGKNYFNLYPSGTKEIFEEVVAKKTPYQAVARPFRFPDQSEQETTYWDWTLVPILDRDNEVDFLVFSLVEVTKGKRAELALSESHALLNALGEAQASYISDTDPNDLFDKLLGELLKITKSEYGFIGQVLRNDNGEPYLKNFATTNIAWNKETREFYEKNKEDGLEFSNMESLFGLVITSGAPVISNDPSTDKRGCGIPEGHPPLNAFLGLPCYINDKLVGMVAIANRPGGYDEEVIKLLSPLLSTTANIIEAFRNDIKRRETEDALQNTEERFKKAQEIAHVGTWDWDPNSGKLIWTDEIYKILGYSPGEVEPSYELFLERVHPDDRERLNKAVTEALENNKPYDIDCRIIRKDGSIGQANAQGEVLSDDQGRPLRMLGLFQDITERKEAEDKLKAERKRLFSILDSFPGFVYLQAEDYTVPFANRRFIEHYGEPAGKTCHELMWDRKTPCDECKTFEVFKTKEPVEWISEHPSHGSAYQVYDYPFIDIDGTFLVLELSIDITKRRQAEKELQNYKVLFDNMTDLAYMLDDEGLILYLNEPFEKLSGFKVEEFVGRSFAPLFEGKDLERAMEAFKKTSGGEALTFELEFKESGIVCEYTSIPLKDLEGRIIGALGTARDVTEKRLADEKLIKSEERFRDIAENAKVWIWEVDKEGRYTYASPMVEKILGYKPEEVVGRYFHEFIEPDERDIVMEKLNAVFDNKEPFLNVMTSKINKAGDTVFCETSGVPILDEDGKLVGYRGSVSDVTERKKAEKALEKSEALLQSVLDNSTTVVYVKDIDGRYLLINSIFEELFHVERKAIIGKTAHDIFPKDLADAFRANDLMVLEAGESIEFEEIVPHDKEDHTYISIKFPLKDSNGNPYAVCGISTDITDRTLMEADRLRMQKLESIGVLAGGIAHDFNNLLTGILGNISLSMIGLDPDDKTYKRLKEAERASFFARDLTQQLLTFSKGGAPVKETFTIEELIKEPAELALRGSAKRCVFEITEGLPSVDVDKGQIGQVINNLVINADQAMPEGGIIKISAEKETIDTNDHLPLSDGDYILIRVADEGTGIPPEHIPKVFDPYFTTKQKGSGLGLASVYSIIKNHAGHIDLTSEIGKGTTFNIYLPVSKTTAARAIKEDEEIIKGSGRVLIMDDEEIIRELLSEFLAQLGYETESASDGLEAVKIYKEALNGATPFKAVIMDLTIQGGVGGKEAIKLLLKEDPEARAIVSSGYSNDPVVANYREYGFSGYLNKPYKVMMLSKVLDTVINGRKE